MLNNNFHSTNVTCWVALLVVQFACSPKPDLSEGPFNIQDAKSHKSIEIITVIEFDKAVFSKSQPLTGKIYLKNAEMFNTVASELGLRFSKTFYYYPNGSMYNHVRIGQGRDTVHFELALDRRKADTEENFSKKIFGGSEALGIRVHFENDSHSQDTTFISYFNPPLRE